MSISGQARIAGIIGWPVGHSRSPRLHGFWLRHYGIDGAYIPLPVAPQNLERAVRALPLMGFAGVNLTLPHKEAAVGLLDTIDPLARRIGAVNTLVIGADGRIEGRNTDAFGFIASLRQDCPSYRPEDGPAVVLGSGGAARAVAAALVDAKAPQIRLVHRTRANAERLAEDIGGPVALVDWRDRAEALAGAGLLVNTTVLGMAGQEPLDLALEALPLSAVVCDIVYVPLITDLLDRARRRGNRIVDGLGMLLHQARPGFAAWFGTMPEVTAELRAYVEAG